MQDKNQFKCIHWRVSHFYNLWIRSLYLMRAKVNEVAAFVEYFQTKIAVEN